MEHLRVDYRIAGNDRIRFELIRSNKFKYFQKVISELIESCLRFDWRSQGGDLCRWRANGHYDDWRFHFDDNWLE